MRMSFALAVSLLALALGAVAPEGSGQPAADSGFAVVFYSGRGGNDDIYLAHPGQREPLNLTRHPARDGWASFVRRPKDAPRGAAGTAPPRDDPGR